MNHEEATIKAFILPVRQERYLEFLKSPKKRAKFIARLAHFKHLNPKFVVGIPGSQQNPSSLQKLLAGKGAGSKSPRRRALQQRAAYSAMTARCVTAHKATAKARSWSP
jgi:hypothetical protein